VKVATGVLPQRHALGGVVSSTSPAEYPIMGALAVAAAVPGSASVKVTERVSCPAAA